MSLKEQTNNSIVDFANRKDINVKFDKDKYYIIGKRIINAKSPRELDSFFEINTFKESAIDEHNYSNSEDLINDLACKADINAVLKLKKEKSLLSHSEFIAKLTTIASSKYLIFPLVLVDSESIIVENLEIGEYYRHKILNKSNIFYRKIDYDKYYSGYAYVSYEKAICEYGNLNNKKNILAIKKRLNEELDSYENWKLCKVYDYKLIKGDISLSDKQARIIESYGILYTKDSLSKIIPKEFRKILKNKDRFIIDNQIYKPKNKSVEEIKEFIKREVPFDKLIKNSGIYETSPLAILNDGSFITVGVSYEDNLDYEEGEENYNNRNLKEFYCYNLFAYIAYIDLYHSYVDKNELIPASTVDEIIYEISLWIKSGDATWIFD